uniref:RxLR effector candidate protein n=1 Tax=Hyaloperonospora arabidopsidis (strain Emoy2) TaxID=559515 RepID=M4B2C1_HYAAE
MATPAPALPSCPPSTTDTLPPHLLSIVTTGDFASLSVAGATVGSNEALDTLLIPVLPLLTRLQSSRRAAATMKSIPKPTALDATLLHVENASKWRQYAQVFIDLTPCKLQAAISSDPQPAFRRFESGLAVDRVMIVLCEWLLAAPGSLESSELFLNEIYQDEVTTIVVQALASPKLQTLQQSVACPLGALSVARKALNVPVGPAMLSRLAVNDPSCVEMLMDAVVTVVVETTTKNKAIVQQEQDALKMVPFVLKNARHACIKLAKLTPLYAAKLCEKLSQQPMSLHCVDMAFELLTSCSSREDMLVFMYQWLKRDGAPGSAVWTYVQFACREAAAGTSEFQQHAVANLKKSWDVLLDTLDSRNVSVMPYKSTAALAVCVGLQVLGSFPLTESDRIRILRSLDALAPSLSSRSISLAFIVVVLLWYPLAPSLSKAPGQRDEHTILAVTLSQQVLVSLFHARQAGTGPLFVVSAVLFYTKAPALVPFLASVIGFGGDTFDSSSILAAGGGIQVRLALRAEYLHVFGDVVLKPVLTESLLAREVLTFPPVVCVSASDAASIGPRHDFTLRGLHGLLCEKSFLRHHHAHELESWIAAQVGDHAALPVHPLLVSLLLEWVENYVMAFEYPIAQSPCRYQLSIVPLRSSTLTKWLTSPLLGQPYKCSSRHKDGLIWARGVLGLAYALQFNQRLRRATMVAGSKLSNLASTSSMCANASVSAGMGPGADICLQYDLSAFPLRNIATQALAHGDQGDVFEFVAPTLLRLMVEEYPQLFDAATASAPSGSTLQLLPLASSPRDLAEYDLRRSWFRCHRKCGDALDIRVEQSPASWTAVHLLLAELQSAPTDIVVHQLLALVDGFLPFAVMSSHTSSRSCEQVAAFCSQLAALYESRVRREQGISVSLAMRLIHSLCFPDALWHQQQVQTREGRPLQLLTYMQVLEEPFRLVEDANDGVFCQPALLRMFLGLVRDVRAAADTHVTKCDPSLVPTDSMAGSTLTTSTVQQHQLLQDCLLVHCLIKRHSILRSESSDDEVAEEGRALLRTIVNELLLADGKSSNPSPPRLLLALHTQGYDATLVPTLVANVPAMKLLWDYWMSSKMTSPSSSSSQATHAMKPLMEFMAEGAEQDMAQWRFRLRVVLSLCATYLSGHRQSAAMQQALRVIWNKLRNGVGNSGESCAQYVSLLSEVLPWIVDACAQNADLSAELVHFLLKLQRQQQTASSERKERDGARKTATEATRRPQDQRQELEQVLHDTYASLLRKI